MNTPLRQGIGHGTSVPRVPVPASSDVSPSPVKNVDTSALALYPRVVAVH